MNRDDLTKYEESYVGDVVRLEIPLKSLMNLRRVAEELRGLAHRLECIGRFAERPAAGMIEAQMIVKAFYAGRNVLARRPPLNFQGLKHAFQFHGARFVNDARDHIGTKQQKNLV